MIRYIAVIDKDPDSDFAFYFPDLPGCVSAGSSPDEARSIAAEALELHLEGMIEDGEPLPDPTARQWSRPTRRTKALWSSSGSRRNRFSRKPPDQAFAT